MKELIDIVDVHNIGIIGNLEWMAGTTAWLSQLKIVPSFLTFDLSYFSD